RGDRADQIPAEVGATRAQVGVVRYGHVSHERGRIDVRVAELCQVTDGDEVVAAIGECLKIHVEVVANGSRCAVDTGVLDVPDPGVSIHLGRVDKPVAAKALGHVKGGEGRPLDRHVVANRGGGTHDFRQMVGSIELVTNAIDSDDSLTQISDTASSKSTVD